MDPTEPVTPSDRTTVELPTPAPVQPAAGAVRVGRTTPRTTAVMAAVAIVSVFAGAALFLSGYTLGAHQATTPGTPVSEEQAFQPFWDAYHYVTDNYAGDTIDRKTLVEGAIKGLFAALNDPYSTYLTADEYRQSLQGINGRFEGIGTTIATKTAAGADSACSTLAADCRLTIVKAIPGSPAEKAGVLPGDVVTKVDGQTVDGLTVDQARDKIRGPKDTVVTLTILRGKRAPFDVPITRDIVQQPEVVARDLAGGTIGYIAVIGFSDTASDAFKTELAADLKKGEKKIILDLRGNPGGFVTSAQVIASQFIASGPIFWQEDAKGVQVETTALSGGLATDPSIKLVVLIDHGSASASEILAGALQDTKRATLVGQTSYGKGTVQQWQPLDQDSGGFRLTVAKWLTPSKRWINGKGLAPDVPVEIPANTPPGSDPVLDKAIDVLGGAAVLELPEAA